MAARRDLLIVAAVAMGVLAALLVLPEPQTLTGAEPFAVTDVLLFDGDRFQDSMDILVEAGRISAIMSNLPLPPGIKRVDGRGHTLIPGLIDGHTHVFGAALTDALAFGVTTELDMFSSVLQVQQARAGRDSLQSTPNADLYSAGTLVTAPGGHGTQFGVAIPTLGPDSDPEAFVAARIAEGSDFIKVVFDDGQGFGDSWPTLSKQQLREVIAAAHQQSRIAVVHVSTLSAAKAAVAAGADGLVHLFADQPVDDEFIQVMQERGAFIVPTLSVLASFSGANNTWEHDPRIADRISAAQRRSLLSRFPFENTEASTLAAQNLMALHTAGVPVVAGTDAPNPGTAHGVSMHLEMQLMAAAGMSVSSVLKSSTSRAGEYFDIGSRGRIAPGARADMVLVRGDIRQNIANSLNLVGVWKNGFEAVTLTSEP